MHRSDRTHDPKAPPETPGATTGLGLGFRNAEAAARGRRHLNGSYPDQNRVFHIATGAGGSSLSQGLSLDDALQGIHPDDRARLRRRLRASARTGVVGTCAFAPTRSTPPVATTAAPAFLLTWTTRRCASRSSSRM